MLPVREVIKVMARKISYESSEVGSILPIAVIGGISYYIYKNWDSISSLIPSFSGSPKTTQEVAQILPASWAGVTEAANAAANAAQIKYNTDYAAAIAANDAAAAEKIRLEALQAQVLIGTPRDARTPINCVQPNYIKDGQCVDPFTEKPVNGVAGVEGLGQILDMNAFFQNGPRSLRKGNFR